MNIFKKDPEITESLYLEWPILEATIFEFVNKKNVNYMVILTFTADKDKNNKLNSVNHPTNKAIVERLREQLDRKLPTGKNITSEIKGIYDIRSDPHYDYLVDDENTYYGFTEVIIHGSPTRGLKTIENKPSPLLDGSHVVFAGAYWAALSFLIRWNDSEFDLGTVDGKPYLRELKPGKLKELENAKGSLYYLSTTNFETDKKLARFEMFSHLDEKVLEEIEIENPLRLMREAGVRIITYANRSKEL